MRVIFLLLLLALCSGASGSVYYLSPQGDDLKGNGSINFPWFTLEKAWKAASAGDTIFLRGGTYAYTSMQDLTGKDGKSGKTIKFWAYPEEKPILTKGASFDMRVQSNLIFIDADFLHLKGLEICYFEQKPGIRASSALFCYTSSSIFENIDYHHNGLAMVIRGKSTDNLILNSDFHHNFDPYNAEPYNHADGLNIAEAPAGTINTVRGCRFYANADDGIDLWNNAGTVIVDNCWAWMNGYREDGISTGGDGSGFKLGKTIIPDYVSYNRILTNNISAYNRVFGITQNAAYCKMFICNNVLVGNKHMGIYFSSSWGDAAHIIRNNIAYKNGTDAAIGLKLAVIDHNSWQRGVPVIDNDFITTDRTQLARKRKDDGSLPDIEFMRPATGSGLIDAGIDVGLPFWGEAPDIGAFETISGSFHQNMHPVVSISFPTKGASFESPATVTIDVDAYDPDGSISKVELFNGTVKIGELTNSPYSFTIKNLSAGSYLVKAVATDNMKASSISTSLEFKVISSKEARDFFNLYPNPNNGRFSIDFSTLLETDLFTITIVDLTGNTVYQEELAREESTRQFDLSHLNSGTYVLMISANQILLTQKLIKG